MIGERRASHDIVKVRMPVGGGGGAERFRTIVEVCQRCESVAGDLGRHKCWVREDADWQQWLQDHEAEEWTP